MSESEAIQRLGQLSNLVSPISRAGRSQRCGGRKRTLEEFRALGRDEGLSLQSITNGSLMEFAPVPADGPGAPCVR